MQAYAFPLVTDRYPPFSLSASLVHSAGAQGADRPYAGGDRPPRLGRVQGTLQRRRVVGGERYRAALGLLVLVAIATALVVAATRLVPPPPVLSEVQLTDRDDGGSVRVARDGTLLVALASNTSTGYAWTVSDRSGEGLALAGEPRYVPPGSTGPVVGAPGTEVFTFRAVQTGTFDLLLEYRRSFEPNEPPVRTFRVTVEID